MNDRAIDLAEEYMKYALSVLGSCLMIALYADTLRVSNKSGKMAVWGAPYYIGHKRAQRVGDVKQIADDQSFIMPELRQNASRYFIISRSKELLGNHILEPFGQVGIRLLPLGQSDLIEAKNSVVINVEDLPEGY